MEANVSNLKIHNTSCFILAPALIKISIGFSLSDETGYPVIGSRNYTM